MKKVKKYCLIAGTLIMAAGGTHLALDHTLFSHGIDQAGSVLSKLNKNERRDLEAFFRYLFYKEGFSFVSIGEIPVSFAGFIDLKNCAQDLIYILKNVRTDGYLEDNYSEQVTVNRGWIVWQKIQEECSKKNLILKQVKDDDNYIYLMIINKENFVNVYNQYRDYFEKELGPYPLDQLLADFCSSQYPFTDVLKDSRILRGILLGFGVHNTELYDRLRKISIQLEMLRNMNAVDTEEYRQLVLEEKDLNQKLRVVSWPEDQDHKIICARKFKVEPTHTETQKLIAQYLSDLEKIKDSYKDKDFLDVTLEQFLE